MNLLFRLRHEENHYRRMAVRERNAVRAFVSPDLSRIWGPDISGRWDGNVDLSVTKYKGGSFVIMKCMDGTVPSPLFRENLQRAVDVRLPAGAYTWLYPDRVVSCVSQARAVVEQLAGLPLTFPLACDFEWTNYAGTAANPDYSDLDKWVTEYNRLAGTRPIFYSCAGYMNPRGTMPAALRDKFAGFWVASYGGLGPTMPAGFGAEDWVMWQFTSSGNAQLLAPGDKGKLELDLNYMSPAFYNKYVGGAMAQQIMGTVVTDAVTIRDKPLGIELGIYLRRGDTIVADFNHYQWLHLLKINGQPVLKDGQPVEQAWASAGSSQQYIQWRWVTVEDPPLPPPYPEPAFPPEIGVTIDGVTKIYVPKVS